MRKDWLDTLRDDARKRLREAKIPFTALGITNNAVQVRLAKAEDADAALKTLRGLIQQTGNLMLGTSITDLEVTKGEGGLIRIAPTEAGLQHRISSAISAAIETVRRRVDAMGTTEPNIVRQGSSRILVQVPGLQDTAQLKELIGKTARLSFHEVHRVDERRGRPPAPAGRVTRSTSASDKEEGRPAPHETPVVRGDELVDAQPGLRPAHQRAHHHLPLQQRRRPQVRQLHQGPRQPAVRHRARRQGDLGAGDPRADPGRLRPDQRQLHGRDRQSAGHPAAVRRAAGQAHHRRGAHRRPLAGRRLHRGRQARRHHRRHRHHHPHHPGLRHVRHLRRASASSCTAC